MRFDELKEKTIENRRIERELARAGHRDWVCPDMTLISVRVLPCEGLLAAAPSISISVSTWRKEEGANSTLEDGRTFTGGWWDHQYEPLSRGSLTAQQLEYVVKARSMCERYVEGFIDKLPDTLF